MESERGKNRGMTSLGARQHPCYERMFQISFQVVKKSGFCFRSCRESYPSVALPRIQLEKKKLGGARLAAGSKGGGFFNAGSFSLRQVRGDLEVLDDASIIKRRVCGCERMTFLY